VKLTSSGEEEVMVSPRPWITVDEPGASWTPGSESTLVIAQPVGAVRLNDEACPLVGVNVYVYEPVVPAGTLPGVTVAVAAPGAAEAGTAMSPASNKRPVRTNGVRQRGVASFTICLLTGLRTNAFAVPRPGDRRMAGEVSRG
jgi:hypothetical protein